MNKGNNLHLISVFSPVAQSMWDTECKFLFVLRYGGFSVGGQLPILEIDPKDIQNAFRQLGRMLNITAVLA